MVDGLNVWQTTACAGGGLGVYEGLKYGVQWVGRKIPYVREAIPDGIPQLRASYKKDFLDFSSQITKTAKQNQALTATIGSLMLFGLITVFAKISQEKASARAIHL